MAFRIDLKATVSGRVEKLPDGSIRVPAYLSRTGIQEYQYADGKIVREYRDAKEVFSQESMNSFRGLSITNRHPKEAVDPTTWKHITIGHIGDDVRQDGEHMAASLYIKDAAAIEMANRGELREVSCGYECEVVKRSGKTDSGADYDSVQTNIVGNHVALGPDGWGRAGSKVRLYLDSNGEIMDPENQEMSPEEQIAEVKAENAKIAASVAELASKVEAVLAKLSEGEEEEEKPADEVQSDSEEEEKPADENKDSDDEELEEKLDCIDSARLVLGSKFDHKGKSVSQIKREVVETKTKSKLDSKKSKDYVSARFDALVEAARSAHSANKKTGSLQEALKNPVEKVDAAQNSREKMLAANRDAWKVTK